MGLAKPRKSALTPVELKLAGDAFDEALCRIHEGRVEMHPHSLRQTLASSVMKQVFAGETDVQIIAATALAELPKSLQHSAERGVTSVRRTK